MKYPVKFIEISAKDFARSAQVYKILLRTKFTVCDSCATEKMAFFSDFSTQPNVAISWVADLLLSKDGVLVSMTGESIEVTFELINVNGGKTFREKMKIEADGIGYFAQFSDSDGNTLGFYSQK